MKNSQKGFIVPLLIIIAALAIGFGVYQYHKNKEIQQNSTAITASSTTNTTVATNTTTAASTSTTATVASSGTKDCGNNIDCFIAQAATCGPAKVEGKLAFGPATLTANLSVKKSATANMCSYTDSAYGTTLVCTVPPSKIITILNDFKKGNSGSADDLTSYNCTTTTSDGTSFDTSSTSGGSAVATHGYTYNEWGSVGDSMSNSAFSYKILAVDTGSMTLSFTNNQTNQSGTLTLQQNVPVVFAKYTITFTGIGQDGATFTLVE